MEEDITNHQLSCFVVHPVGCSSATSFMRRFISITGSVIENDFWTNPPPPTLSYQFCTSFKNRSLGNYPITSHSLNFLPFPFPFFSFSFLTLAFHSFLPLSLGPVQSWSVERAHKLQFNMYVYGLRLWQWPRSGRSALKLQLGAFTARPRYIYLTLGH